MARASRAGSACGSSGPRSTRGSSSRVRCRWRRNWCPSHPYYPEVRVEGGERIVGDLRPRVAHRRDERRLAGIGHAEQAHVGQHLELQHQAAMLALLARRRLARRAVGAGLEMEVAEAALAALGEQRHLFVLREVGDRLAAVLVADLRAHRHAQPDVLGRGAVLVGAAAALAVPCDELALVAVVHQRVDVAVGHRPDAAAATAVAAVRAAPRNELLAPERRRAVAAVAGSDLDARFVDELHRGFPESGARRNAAARAADKKAPRGGASCGAAGRVTAAVRR